jgi:hypothetical protein
MSSVMRETVQPACMCVCEGMCVGISVCGKRRVSDVNVSSVQRDARSSAANLHVCV